MEVSNIKSNSNVNNNSSNNDNATKADIAISKFSTDEIGTFLHQFEIHQNAEQKIGADQLKRILQEMKLGDNDVQKVIHRFSSRNDHMIDFPEFLILIEHYKDVMLRGLMKDSSKLANWYQLGWLCCLCTAGMSFIPFCCLKSQLQNRAKSSHYAKQDLKKQSITIGMK